MQDEALLQCGLWLFDDPALEAQPRHEVAVRVGRRELSARDALRPCVRFGGVHRFEDPVGRTAIVPNCGPLSLKVLYVLYGVVMLFYAIPWRWWILTCCCGCYCLLRYKIDIKMTDNPQGMLCVRPLEFGIHTHKPCTSMCDPCAGHRHGGN